MQQCSTANYSNIRIWLQEKRKGEGQGSGFATPMKMGGGGTGTRRQRSQDFSGGNPYQKPKTQRIWSTIFLKMGGIIPRTLKNGGNASPPVAEPLEEGAVEASQSESSFDTAFLHS